jgi:hypothetical protein
MRQTYSLVPKDIRHPCGLREAIKDIVLFQAAASSANLAPRMSRQFSQLTLSESSPKMSMVLEPVFGRRSSSKPAFLNGGGACAELIASTDWSVTPLGPIANWPHCLRIATSLLLRSQVPIVMLWGEEGVMLYNDAYSGFAGGRHPELLGSNVREGWPEVADFNDHVIKVGLAGDTLHYRNQELTLFRNGAPGWTWTNPRCSTMQASRPASSAYSPKRPNV